MVLSTQVTSFGGLSADPQAGLIAFAMENAMDRMNKCQIAHFAATSRWTPKRLDQLPPFVPRIVDARIHGMVNKVSRSMPAGEIRRHSGIGQCRREPRAFRVFR